MNAGHVCDSQKQTIVENVIELGTDIQCKYMIFMPELYRHTSWIYLESIAGVSMLQGRPQSFTTVEGPPLI